MAFVEPPRSRPPIRSPTVRAPPVASLHPPIGPPAQGSVFQFRAPSFCPQCYSQFNSSFALGGLCPHCNTLLPQLAAPTALPRHLLHLPTRTPTQDNHFVMTDMLHVIEDVIKDQEEGELSTPLVASPVVMTPVQFKPEQCSCGSNKMVLVCSVCQAYVCGECVASHDKEHQIPPILSFPASNVPIEDDSPKTCSKHNDVKVSLFCQSCLCTTCQSCAVNDHSGHSLTSLPEAYSHYRPSVEQLRSKSEVEIHLLDLSLTEAEKMCNSVSERRTEAVETVRQVFQEHRAAIDRREQEVIAQINAIAELRLKNLGNEIGTLKEHLSLLKSLSSQAKAAQQDHSQADLLETHFKLSDSLQKYHSIHRNPSEDDSFIIQPNPGVAEESLKTLCIFTTAPHPPLCTAMGEGLYHPRVNRLCTVTLCTKDRRGENCLEGGERLFVQLKSVCNGGATLSVDVRDNSDGSYSINFKPRVKGEHQLVVAIRGQHVQGSPFTLLVDGGREYGRFGMVSHVFGSEGSTNGQFCRPWGICCDHHGNLIIGDRSNHRVQVFDCNGQFKYQFGSEGNHPGQFNRPAGVAITREGHIVVADKDNHRIQVLQLDGSFLFMFGSKGGNDGQMIYPYDVAVNRVDGRIAVTDTGNHRLLIFSHDGILLGKFGYKGYLCGHFDSPRGIAFNDDGHIIVSDFNVHHILVIHPDGTTARILGSQGGGNGQFMRPQGIAIDHMGHYIIADTRNNRIVIMHPNGHFVAKFGSAGQGPGQFDRPTSVTVMPDGRIAVVDFGNSRVQIF